MVASSIQVSAKTRRRLQAYKAPGMTYDQVLNLLMEVLTPDEFDRLYREWQGRFVADLRKSSKWKEFTP